MLFSQCVAAMGQCGRQVLISLLPAPAGQLQLAIALPSPQQTQVQGRELCPLHGLRRSRRAWLGAPGVMWQQPSPCLLAFSGASTLPEPRQGTGSSTPTPPETPYPSNPMGPPPAHTEGTKATTLPC